MTDVETSMQELQLNDKTRCINDIVYCGKCTIPLEYCEFGASAVQCRKWCLDNHKDLYSKIYGAPDDDEPKTEEQDKPKQQSSKKSKQPASNIVTITIVERTKRKRVTHIQGLELFGVDLKKAAKMFANKFATGSAVSKTGAGLEEIVIQGDCSFELPDYIVDNFPITSKDLEIVEGKKK